EERKTNSLEVSWDKSDCAQKYYVQVHRKDGWVKVGTTSETNIEIPDLNSASNYRIRVRAYKKVDDVNYYGIYSDEFETATKPAKPTELKTTSVTPTSFTLKWKKQSNASYYEVYQYNYSDKKYELFKTVNGGKNNYLNVDSLAENKKYTFRVKAYKKSKDGKLLKSAKSDKFYAYTSLRAPKISSAKSGASKRISVNWKKVSGASGYQVMWSTTSNFSSNYKSVYVSGKSLSTVLTTAQSNKTYYVKVRAFKTRNNKKLYSPWSSKLSVKTK
ncbi:MAG: fibronectin type III domain-containing protein, partial [Eubacterium sp.]|nr:fibronectin type III domain-containing protein [Eubacterium sp.]